MRETDDNKRGKREKTEVEKEEEVLKWLYDMDNELIRWMTEETNPNNTPRSDCG